MPDNRTYDEVRENDDASVLFDIMYRHSSEPWLTRVWMWKIKAPAEVRWTMFKYSVRRCLKRFKRQTPPAPVMTIASKHEPLRHPGTRTDNHTR